MSNDATDYDMNAFIEWVFQRNDLPLNDLPEDTLLRKNMKAYLWLCCGIWQKQED